MKILVRLIKVFIAYPASVMLSILLSFLTVMSSSALLGISALLISNAALHVPIGELTVAIVGVRFFGIIRAVCRYAERYISHNTTFRILSRFRGWFYRKLEPHVPSILLEHHSGDLFSRMVGDVESMKEFYLRVFSPLLTAILVLLSVSIFLGFFDRRLAIVEIAFFVLAVLAAPVFVGIIGRGAGERVARLKAEFAVRAVDCISGMTEVLAFGMEKVQLNRVRHLSSSLMAEQRRAAFLSGFSGAVVSVAGNLAMWFALLICIPLVNSTRMQGPHMAMILLVILASFEIVQGMPLMFYKLEESMAAAGRLLQIEDRQPVIDEEKSGSCEIYNYDLSVKDVGMSYSKGRKPILENITFEFPFRKKIAVVGPSGSGKSTLINVLLRLWDYDRGTVTIGGEEIKKINPEKYRGCFSAALQNPYLFNATIRENLLLAKPDAADEELEKAAEIAQMADFIHSLPQGLDTFVGEGAFKLSGGQRQRLAIARAVLKGSPILVLDEPTDGLDPVTESKLIEALNQFAADRSLLMVTHRLVGIETMDEILVMNHGEIVERGTHAILLSQNGIYRKLWDLQRQALPNET